MGSVVGFGVGSVVGFGVGAVVGFGVCAVVGFRVGAVVGFRVGAVVGFGVGAVVDFRVDAVIGFGVGAVVGFAAVVVVACFMAVFIDEPFTVRFLKCFLDGRVGKRKLVDIILLFLNVVTFQLIVAATSVTFPGSFEEEEAVLTSKYKHISCTHTPVITEFIALNT